jgi:hypothetical protein
MTRRILRRMKSIFPIGAAFSAQINIHGLHTPLLKCIYYVLHMIGLKLGNILSSQMDKIFEYIHRLGSMHETRPRKYGLSWLIPVLC